VIFGKWTPFGAAAGAMLFGFAQALNSRFQIAEVPIPPQFIQMTPYIVTMVVLAGLVGRAVAPRASGTPYKKE
jgi:general nucleoside transport system permease protein